MHGAPFRGIRLGFLTAAYGSFNDMILLITD